MNNTNQSLLKDRMLISGLLAILLSATTFFFSEDVIKANQSVDFSIFFFNYAITLIYSIAVWANAFRNHPGETVCQQIRLHRIDVNFMVYQCIRFKPRYERV